jgi:hypothetical protein
MASSSMRAWCRRPAQANAMPRGVSSASLPARRVTVGGDKGYDTRDFVVTLRARDATRHIAQRAKTHTLDARTTRHGGYQLSQRARKRIEEVFGWMKERRRRPQIAPSRWRSRELPIRLHRGGV